MPIPHAHRSGAVALVSARASSIYGHGSTLAHVGTSEGANQYSSKVQQCPRCSALYSGGSPALSAPERGLARSTPSLCKQGVRGSSPLGSTGKVPSHGHAPMSSVGNRSGRSFTGISHDPGNGRSEAARGGLSAFLGGLDVDGQVNRHRVPKEGSGIGRCLPSSMHDRGHRVTHAVELHLGNPGQMGQDREPVRISLCAPSGSTRT
jgi:hypothetical protein